MIAQASPIKDSYIDDFKVRCPRCTAALEPAINVESTLNCVECHFPMVRRKGIWHALPVERAAYYSRFIKDYEAIRMSEGRGSNNSSYYLNLPDVAISGNNAEQWKIRARTYGFLRRDIFSGFNTSSQHPIRILDIGAGNCWLSYRLSQIGIHPVAVDLLINEMDGLGAATHYDAHLDRPFLRIQAESNRLPFCDAQFDAAIFNASFHYAESYERTLREALRCLRIGGTLIIADSPWYSCEQSGEKMLVERRSHFFNRFGIFSDSIHSKEFLTDQRLELLAQTFGLRWEQHTPFYGLRWLLRPWLAKLNRQREPSKFRIFIAKKQP
jgi:SAM-dependent methyltransferase